MIGATLSAQIDPGGLPTSYRIEYGTSTSYGTSTPEENIGEGNISVPVRVDLSGLQPATRYHFRIVAINALGTTDGPDVTFGTYVSVAGLPDGRVYEPVTPVGSIQDENIYAPNAYFPFTPFGEHGIFAGNTLPFQAAVDGEAVVYAGEPPVTGGTSAVGASFGNEYLSTRLPGGGWTQVPLESEANGKHDQYVAFTTDLSVGLSDGHNIPDTDALHGYESLYTHTMAGGVGGEYDPLFTAAPDRPGSELVADGSLNGLVYAGANTGAGAVPASSHLLFESNAGLLEGEGDLEKELGEDVRREVEEGKHSSLVHYLYDSVDGRPYLVDVLPNGRVAPGASFGAVEAGLGPNGVPGAGPGFTRVISADGSRVFWTAAPEAFVNTHTSSELAPIEKRSQALYVRENDTQPQSPVGPEEECMIATDACTVQVDAAVGGGGIFQGASADGSKVFFTKGNLYEYNLGTAETTNLSPGVEVKGVAGISENGEYVYYVDASDNIDLWHGGVTTRVATNGAKNSGDYPTGNVALTSDYEEEIGSRTAEVTPDGQSLVFMSNASLTGYDNRGFRKDSGLGTMVEEAIEEVFLYEAPSGKLRCVSCDPTGEAPVLTNASAVATAGAIAKGETSLVGAELPVSLEPTYQPQWISEDGSRVFFDSAQPLVPQATSGWLDVYEWERDGSGSCQQGEGCIYLLSSGSDPENTYLLDASASGNDVFLITRAQLVAQDRNDVLDVYDARVGGVHPTTPPECSGTGCQGVPPAPPIFATPASVTFEGTGNFPPPAPAAPKKKTAAKSRCAKPKKLSHGKCVKTKAKGAVGKHRAKAKKSARPLKSDRRSK